MRLEESKRKDCNIHFKKKIMKEKELMHFVLSLYNRGLLVKSPEELDYEEVIWDYLKVFELKPIRLIPFELSEESKKYLEFMKQNQRLYHEHCKELLMIPKEREGRVVSLPDEKRKEMIQKVLDRK